MGLNNYQYHFEVYLRYMLLLVHKKSGTTILAMIDARRVSATLAATARTRLGKENAVVDAGDPQVYARGYDLGNVGFRA